MLSVEVVPRMAPAALHEPNGWRLAALYADPRVNDVLVEHIEPITVGCKSNATSVSFHCVLNSYFARHAHTESITVRCSSNLVQLSSQMVVC